MQFNTFLRDTGLDPDDVSVILHLTTLPRWRRNLPRVVAERPDLFAAYQSVHTGRAAATLLGRTYAASFVPLASGNLVFVGVFRCDPQGLHPVDKLYSDKRFQILEEQWGATDLSPKKNIALGGSQHLFLMTPLPMLADLIGRLVINAPIGRTYVRLAQRLNAPVISISETSLLQAPPPVWRDMVLSAEEVRNLPEAWKARLKEWRGVYLIVDQENGKGYVGSAYNEENLLGRWQEHVAADNGITVELANRQTKDFRFSILERVSPDMEAVEVIKIEQNWKLRLDTIKHGLNRN